MYNFVHVQLYSIVHLFTFFSRWRTCVGAAKGSLANAVGAMYVREYFREDSKIAALEMVHDIRSEFDTMIEHIDWMDDLTKSRYDLDFLFLAFKNSKSQFLYA